MWKGRRNCVDVTGKVIPIILVYPVAKSLYRLSVPEGSPDINLCVIWTSKCDAIFHSASAISRALQLIRAFHGMRKAKPFAVLFVHAPVTDERCIVLV
jgi:hypothetical protein